MRWQGSRDDDVRGLARAARRAAARRAFALAVARPRFIILSVGRSGSELLVSLLGSHPDIVCESEILSVRRRSPWSFLLRRAASARLRGKAYGFKLLGHHPQLQYAGDAGQFVRRLHELGFHVIALERRDWFGQAVSAIRAAATEYHVRTSDRARFSPVHLDPVAVLAALYLVEDGVTSMRAALEGVPALRLVYEDDLGDERRQQRTVERICAHLGLARADVTTDLVKLTPRSPAKGVANFDEISELISNTRFRSFLPAEAPQLPPRP